VVVVVLVVVEAVMVVVVIIIIIIIIIVIIIIILVKNCFCSLSQTLHPNGTRTRGWLRGKCCISVIINSNRDIHNSHRSSCVRVSSYKVYLVRGRWRCPPIIMTYEQGANVIS